MLDVQYAAFEASWPIAEKTKHPIPMDTRAWSQILVSVITGLQGAAQKKGADFQDGSDVKAANCWKAIDTPRFNGVAKAGTKAKHAGSIESFRKMPHLFFVLWDTSPSTKRPRCRIWVVRPQTDSKFLDLCQSWYQNAKNQKIKSTNLQLHPPRNRDGNDFRNKCGNLEYPLYFCAERDEDGFKLLTHDVAQLAFGECREIQSVPMVPATEKPTNKGSRKRRREFR